MPLLAMLLFVLCRVRAGVIVVANAPCAEGRPCLHLQHLPRTDFRAARRHTTRFVLIYIVFLPLALWRHLNYYTIGVAPLITFLLAGIENIGVMIENPMRIMPMAAYCATIHGNVMFVGGDWAAGNFVRPPRSFATPGRAELGTFHHAALDASHLHAWLVAPSRPVYAWSCPTHVHTRER